MRLDKFIAHSTQLSRTETKRCIKAGAVAINGQVAQAPTAKVGAEDIVTLHQAVLAPPKPRYFMLHKPEGYICATQDSEHPIVLDLLSEPNLQGLHIVGRLDKDTTGLVLITDDGQWGHRISSPSHQHSKCYQVRVARPLQPEWVARFAEGIPLRNEKKPTQPATLKLIGEHQAELHIQEGKYHQVKRMFAAVGNHVTQLHRSQIGPLPLDPTLKPGQYRPLTPEEIHHFDP